jgi:two-component system sensor histidine kinase KdpD
MGGTLTPEETPGGGLTMVVSLPASPSSESPAEQEPGRREREGAEQSHDDHASEPTTLRESR